MEHLHRREFELQSHQTAAKKSEELIATHTRAAYK